MDRPTGDPHLELLGRRLRLVALLEVGDVGEVDTEIRRFAHVAEPLRQPLYLWYVPLWRGMRSLMRGESRRRRRDAPAGGIGAGPQRQRPALTSPSGGCGSATKAGSPRRERRWRSCSGGAVRGPPVTAAPRAVAALPDGLSRQARVAAGAVAGRRARRIARGIPSSAEPGHSPRPPSPGGWVTSAALLYDQLRPYAHRCCVEGIAAACTGSVAWYLAMVARFLGHHDRGRDLRRARPARPNAGSVWSGDPPPRPGRRNRTPDRDGSRRPPPHWSARAPPGPSPSRAVPAGCGTAKACGTWPPCWPGRSTRCTACSWSAGPTSVHRSDPRWTSHARRAYESRIRDLQEDIDDARAANDLVRAERAEAELDALVQQLAEAFGLAGRSRATGSAAERARSAVGWRIRSAIRQAADAHRGTGSHLRTLEPAGRMVRYQPESPVSWRIDGV